MTFLPQFVSVRSHVTGKTDLFLGACCRFIHCAAIAIVVVLLGGRKRDCADWPLKRKPGLCGIRGLCLRAAEMLSGGYCGQNSCLTQKHPADLSSPIAPVVIFQ